MIYLVNSNHPFINILSYNSNSNICLKLSKVEVDGEKILRDSGYVTQNFAAPGLPIMCFGGDMFEVKRHQHYGMVTFGDLSEGNN